MQWARRALSWHDEIEILPALSWIAWQSQGFLCQPKSTESTESTESRLTRD